MGSFSWQAIEKVLKGSILNEQPGLHIVNGNPGDSILYDTVCYELQFI